jgi:hypothetical protein
MSNPRLPVETAADPFFRRLVAVSTGLAFGGMLASLAVFERASHGKLALRWHWAAVPLLGVGLFLGLRFWNVLWRAEEEGTPGARARLRRFTWLLGAVAVASFSYPMRYVQASRMGEVLAGLGLAIVVLAGMGVLIWKTIRWVNENELPDGQPGPDDSRRP